MKTNYQNIIGENAENVIGPLTRADNRPLDKLETQAIDFIRTIYRLKGHVWLAYSGGKDSEILYHLCKKAGIEFTCYYNNTTIDHPGTIKWVKQHENVIIMPPKHTFFYLIQHKGFPSTFRRFCCEKLKERYVVPSYMTGVRAYESKRRREKYTEPETCMKYANGKTAQVYMPILQWTDKNVEEYINEESIHCHPIYYDCNGKFCVNRRLGCIGCPLPYDKGLSTFLKYPRMVRAWCRSMAIYRNTRKEITRMIASFEDEYENFYFHLFCDTIEQVHQERDNLFGFDPRQLLMDYFEIDLPPAASKLSDLKRRLPMAQQPNPTDNKSL